MERSTISSAVRPVAIVLAVVFGIMVACKLASKSPTKLSVSIGYHLVLVQELGQQKLAMQYCMPIGGCHLMGYRWDPNDAFQAADAEDTYNSFTHPVETKVLSVVK